MNEISNAGLGALFGKANNSASGMTSHGRDVLPAPRRGGAGSFFSGLVERTRGPGGYYNLGNVLGLVMGITVQVASVPAGTSDTGLWAYFAGSPSAFAMSVATAIFVVSGETYHRAFQGAETNQGLYRFADLLSGLGALALGIALFTLGHPILAATAGLLHAAGKLGSAAMPVMPGTWTFWPSRWPDPFRSAVVASRVPAMIAASADFWASLNGAISGGPALAMVTPATLIVCYLLWAKADLLLIEDDFARLAAAPTMPVATAASR